MELLTLYVGNKFNDSSWIQSKNSHFLPVGNYIGTYQKRSLHSKQAIHANAWLKLESAESTEAEFSKFTFLLYCFLILKSNCVCTLELI